ncbi:MAG: TspO/MBR family protein [Terrimesophilobacter sp.]
MTKIADKRQSGTADTVRQWVVFLSFVMAIVGSAIGSGAFGGTPIQEAAGGALRADATLIAPAVPAFSIWSVIYLGLAALSIWQLLPGQKTDQRQRQMGYLIAASLVLNAAWILSIQAGLLAVSVVVIAALLFVLAWLFKLCVASAAKNWIDAVLVDGALGLYLGWVAIASAANVTAFLVSSGFDGWGIDPNVWAVIVISVAGLIGVGLAVYGGGRLGATLSLGWGLAWVAVQRLTGEPHSEPAGIAAIVAVALMILVTVIWRVGGTRGRVAASD